MDQSYVPELCQDFIDVLGHVGGPFAEGRRHLGSDGLRIAGPVT
jgi:hypothetical protein